MQSSLNNSNSLANYLLVHADLIVVSYIAFALFIFLLLVSIGLTLGRIERLIKEQNVRLSTNDKKGVESLHEDDN